MLFDKIIRELRIGLQMPQRLLSYALGIETATYCKVAKEERKVKKEQIETISRVFNIDANICLNYVLLIE